MKRVLGHCLAAASLMGVAVAVFSACVHDDESLFVQDVIYPTPVSAGNACTFTPDPNQSFLPEGTLDIGLTDQPYVAAFLLGNQLVSRSNSQQLQVETSTINIEGGVVRVTDAAGNQLTTFTSLTSGTVYPSAGTSPGYAATFLTVLDSATAASLGKAGKVTTSSSVVVVTYSKFFGHTLGGTYVESNEFEYPITICDGCLVSFSSNDINLGFALPNCLGGATGGGNSGSSVPSPCRFGQDTAVDCSECRGNPVCEGAYGGKPLPNLDAGGGG